MHLVLLTLLLAPIDEPNSAPPLADPPGITNTVTVSNVAQLNSAIAGLTSNTKIVINPGTYNLTGSLAVSGGITNVIIRGGTGNRNDVVLQGAGMGNNSVLHGFWIGDAANIVIADMSIGSVFWHPIQLDPGSGADTPTFYNLRLFDAGEQFIKSSSNSGGGAGVSNGRVEYCVIEYTTTAPSDYTNGVDVHGGANWIIRHCEFRNIRSPAGQPLAGPAILMWNYSSGTISEGNSFINCERGIAYGLIDRTPGFDHQGGIIRNNIFYRSSGQSGDTGIYICDSPNTQVLHNTVLTSGTYGTPIEYRFTDTTNILIQNNLLDGTIWQRNGATGTVNNNNTSATPGMFVSPAGEDFHLVAGATAAIDQGVVAANCTDDWDGGARGGSPDLGADEFGVSGGGTTTTPGGGGTGGGGGGGGHRSGGGCSAGATSGTSLLLVILVVWFLGWRTCRNAR